MMSLYRLLLYLYPSSYRRDYGDELLALHVRQGRMAEGGLGTVSFWWSAVVDVVHNAVAVHYDLLRQDLRHSVRGMRRRPGFALTFAVVVALGCGANTAVFSVADYVLLRPLPFPEPGRLLKLWENRRGYSEMELSPANYFDWQERATTLEGLAAFFPTAANLVDGGEPIRLEGAAVGWQLFDVLGIAPDIGRGFASDDENASAPHVVVLGQALWRSRFGGRPDVVGQTVRLDDVPYTVVGIMPAGFRYPDRDVDYWQPMRLDEETRRSRTDNFLQVVGRMRDGVTLLEVKTDLERVTQQLETEYPIENRHTGATVYRLRDELSRQSRLLLIALVGAAACVLLITGVNLANLLLARASARRRELLLRSAMGAGRERLARQLLTETLFLALPGGALGMGLALLTLPLLSRLVPATLPMATGPTLDLRVLLFGLALTLGVGVLVGWLPVIRATRGGFTELRSGERAGAGERQGLRAALVVGGIVCSVVLLAAAGLLLRALWEVQSTEPGFESEGVLTLRAALPFPRYAETKTRVQFYEEVVREIRALPGVTNAAFTSFLPMVMTGGIWPVGLAGSSDRRESGNVASLRFVTPGFFDTLGIRRLAGRDLLSSDDSEHPNVAVVSESFVRHYFPAVAGRHKSAIGESFEFAFVERQIVGVVGDVRVRGLERSSEPQVYLPAGQVPDGWLQFYAPKDLAIRSTLAADKLLPAVEAILKRADPDQPFSDVRTLSAIVATQTASRSVQLSVVAAFAATALLLSAVGLHGLLLFLVAQRQREIGVRLALGAGRRDIVRWIVGRATALASLGAGVGVLLAYFAGRRLEELLAGVPAADPWTLLAVAGLCALMTVAGSLTPTLRALRVDPVVAMRQE